jgi:glutamate-1-semialdehyde 2,1-aminomutase
MFTIFFRSEVPSAFHEVKECDFEAFGRFHRRALDNGVYFPPSQYEAVFLSATINDADIEHLEKAVATALQN